MTPAVAVYVAVMLLKNDQPGDAITMLMLGLGFLMLTGMFTFPCRYTILPDTLSIRCGIVCYQVPFAEIESVDPTASLRSGPALSTRRLAVVTSKRSYLISPKDRGQFLAVIQESIQQNQQNN